MSRCPLSRSSFYGGVYPGRAGWLLVSAFCRGTRFRVSSSDRAIYPGRREVPRCPLLFPHLMGVFTPVAAGWLLVSAFCRGAWVRVSSSDRGVCPPRRPSPARHSALFLPRPNNRPRRPASCCRPWSCPASVPIAGNDSRRQARIAEAVGVGRARRRPRRTRGWLCAELSPPHWIRGRRPPKAGNRTRQIRGKLVWHRTAALGFGRLRRPRRPRPRGVIRTRREAEGRGRATTSDRDPRPMAQARATLRTSKAQANRARGWEIPEAAVWTSKARTNADKGNAAEPSLGRRTAHFNANAAAPRRGATAIQPPSWDLSRTSPSARVWWL